MNDETDYAPTIQIVPNPPPMYATFDVAGTQITATSEKYIQWLHDRLKEARFHFVEHRMDCALFESHGQCTCGLDGWIEKTSGLT